MSERNELRGYVFGAALAAVAVGGVPGLMERAHAGSITAADFTFETSGQAFSTSVTSPSIGPLIAESGIGSAYGSHAAATTVYTSPAGNGSARSFSANNFTAGDYFQFSVPTSNLNDILVAFDQVSSSTGPKVFALYYSTDGSNFSSFATYNNSFSATSTGTAGSATVGFSTGANNSIFNHSFNLSGVAGLINDASAAFRLVEADTTTATTGTSRVDNFVVSGDSLGAAIPEPAALAMTSVAGGLSLLRRKRSRA